MKINKLSEELQDTRLLEAEEVQGEIDTSSPVSEIADELADAVVDATEGEETLGDSTAAKIAAEVKKVADETGIETAALDAGPLGVENPITKVLDMALNKSKKDKRRNAKSGYNVLIIGLPGSGKTASILDWAASRGVNLVSINAKNNDLDAYINGYTTKRPDDPLKVTQAFSDNLDDLEKENSVLFLDEYNRQVKPHIRASLYTLINEHRIVGNGPGRQHEFKNMLFTIAAINPPGSTDKGAAELNDAEKSRFWWTLSDMDSDPATTLDFLTKYYNNKINLLKSSDADYLENLEDYLRIQDLGLFVVSHPKFAYDTAEDLDDLSLTKAVLLCQRSLTTGLHNSYGIVDDFKFWVERGANFLPRDKEMLLSILKEYINPTFEDLCRGRGIDPTAGGGVKMPTTEVESPAAADASSSVDIEDDDEFFVTSEHAGKVRVKNPYEVELAIASAIENW